MEQITPRRLGTNPLIETKAESELKVNKKNYYNYIIEILNDVNKPLSAKEIAVEMKRRGFTKTDERNAAAPRITEMMQKGWIECVGTKKCQYTNTQVGVFMIRQKS